MGECEGVGVAGGRVNPEQSTFFSRPTDLVPQSFRRGPLRIPLSENAHTGEQFDEKIAA